MTATSDAFKDIVPPLLHPYHSLARYLQCLRRWKFLFSFLENVWPLPSNRIRRRGRQALSHPDPKPDRSATQLLGHRVSPEYKFFLLSCYQHAKYKPRPRQFAFLKACEFVRSYVIWRTTRMASETATYHTVILSDQTPADESLSGHREIQVVVRSSSKVTERKLIDVASTLTRNPRMNQGWTTLHAIVDASSRREKERLSLDPAKIEITLLRKFRHPSRRIRGSFLPFLLRSFLFGDALFAGSVTLKGERHSIQ
jgi:hypothetical protein